jgi:CheY-like chemotaxis protein
MEGTGTKGPAGTFRRLGVRLGLLDTGPEPELDQAPESDPPSEIAVQETQVQPLMGAPKLMDAPKLVDAPSGLENLSTAVSEQPVTVLVPRPAQPVLAGKSIAIIGFSRSEQKAIENIVQAQSGIPVAQAHQDASTVSFRWPHCDLLMVMAPPEWAVTEPIDPGWLAYVEKPLLLFGSRAVLARAVPRFPPGARDLIPTPWAEDDVTWRAAVLLARSSRTPAQPVRQARRAKPEILIADDDATTRTLLQATLTRHGMLCHAADNGGDALEFVRRERPDALVLDVGMPCLDGFQVLAAVKQDPALSSIQVVLLTGRQAEVDVLQGFGLGADDYLVKPFSPMELAARLKRLLARSV